MSARTTASDLPDRLAFYAIPEPNSGCLLWTGAILSKGYGILRYDGKTRKAHRLSWEVHRGPIPQGMHVLHKCDVPGCINVEHLFLGTNRDNVDDKVAKGRHRNARHLARVPRGERHGCARLSSKDVLAIRADARSQQSIANEYGVSQTAVGMIKRGVRWKHL